MLFLTELFFAILWGILILLGFYGVSLGIKQANIVSFIVGILIIVIFGWVEFVWVWTMIDFNT